MSLVAGCSSPSASASIPGDHITFSTERDGVRLTLTLEGRPVSNGRSWARAQVANVGQRAVRWAGGGCDHPVTLGIDLTPAFAAGREWPDLLGRFKAMALGGRFGNPSSGFYVEESLIREPADIPMLCTADLRINELAPNQVLEMRAAWNGQLGNTFDDSPAPAPNGPAVVAASFPFIGHAGVVEPTETDTRPIVIKVPTEVVGGGGVVPLAPALAIDSALADDAFADFVQRHPEARWINPHLLLRDGSWGVGLFVMSDDGQGELFGEVTVDPTGMVVGHRFEP